MYAKINNGQITEYPLSELEIRSRFTDRSIDPDFANNLPDGYVRVFANSAPSETDTTVVAEILPTLQDGVWVQTWAVTDKFTPEELAKHVADQEAQKWVRMRAYRDSALAKSEWVVTRHKEQKELGHPTTINDGVYMSWLTYRQQLRDFPTTVTNIDSYALPAPPGELGVA